MKRDTIQLQVINQSDVGVSITVGGKMQSSQIFAVRVGEQFTIQKDAQTKGISVDLTDGEPSQDLPDSAHCIQLYLYVDKSSLGPTFTKIIEDVGKTKTSDSDVLDIIIQFDQVSHYKKPIPDKPTPMFFIQEVRSGDGTGGGQ